MNGGKDSSMGWDGTERHGGGGDGWTEWDGTVRMDWRRIGGYTVIDPMSKPIHEDGKSKRNEENRNDDVVGKQREGEGAGKGPDLEIRRVLIFRTICSTSSSAVSENFTARVIHCDPDTDFGRRIRTVVELGTGAGRCASMAAAVGSSCSEGGK